MNSFFRYVKTPTLGFLLLFLVMPLSLEAASKDVKKPEPLSMEIPFGRLTLAQAQQIALRASPAVAEMLARIKEAQAVCKQARATLWPTLSVHAGHDWLDLSMRPDWNPEVRMEEDLKHFNTGIQINWLLFDGFSRQASILAAKAETQAAKDVANDVCRLLAESVAGAYYQAQLAAEGMQIAKQNSLFNRNLELDAEKSCRAGAIPQAEYLNFSVKSLQAENNFLKARQHYSVVCIMLARLMALPETQLPREMHPVAGEPIEALAELPQLKDELAYAMSNRPDLKALAANKEALLQEKRRDKGTWYPKVYFHGNYDYDEYRDYGAIDQNEHGSAIGFSMDWELFSGGERSAKIRATEAKLMQLNMQKEQKILEIQAALRHALVRADSTRAVYQRGLYTLTLVRQIRDHVERSYRAGATTLTRLNEAQTDLVTVSAAVATSRINHLQQLESLRAASGRILQGRKLILPYIAEGSNR